MTLLRTAFLLASLLAALPVQAQLAVKIGVLNDQSGPIVLKKAVVVGRPR